MNIRQESSCATRNSITRPASASILGMPKDTEVRPVSRTSSIDTLPLEPVSGSAAEQKPTCVEVHPTSEQPETLKESELRSELYFPPLVHIAEKEALISKLLMTREEREILYNQFSDSEKRNLPLLSSEQIEYILLEPTIESARDTWTYFRNTDQVWNYINYERNSKLPRPDLTKREVLRILACPLEHRKPSCVGGLFTGAFGTACFAFTVKTSCPCISACCCTVAAIGFCSRADDTYFRLSNPHSRGIDSSTVTPTSPSSQSIPSDTPPAASPAQLPEMK